MSKIKAMKQAILDEKVARGVECMEVVFEVLKDYNCTLQVIPKYVEVAPDVFATSIAWKATALDD